MTEDKSSQDADVRPATRSPATQSQQHRQDRQCAALRANLKKRKHQSSARKAPQNDPDSDTETHG